MAPPVSPPVAVVNAVERIRVIVRRMTGHHHHHQQHQQQQQPESGAGAFGAGAGGAGGGGLGLSIAGGIESTPFVDDDPGLFISKLVPGGAAECAGVRVGDKVLDINGTPMVGQRHQFAVQCIQHSSGIVELLLERQKKTGTGTEEKCSPFLSSSSAAAAFGAAASPSVMPCSIAGGGAAGAVHNQNHQHHRQSSPPPAHSPPALPLQQHQQRQQQRAVQQRPSQQIHATSNSTAATTNASSLCSNNTVAPPQPQQHFDAAVPPVPPVPSSLALFVAELPFGDSRLDGTVEEVELVRDARNSLGLSIVGGVDHCSHPFGTPANPGVFISRIAPNSPADATRRLRIGDRILRVCSRDISGARHNDAVDALKATGRTLTITVRHERQPDGLRAVVVPRRDTHPLGLNICGGIGSTPMNPLDRTDEGIFIERVERGGPGDQCMGVSCVGGAAGGNGGNPLLTVGTRVLEVNEESLLGCTKEEAAQIFRSARPGPVRLLVCDGFAPGGPSSRGVPPLPTPSASSTMPPSSTIVGTIAGTRTDHQQQRQNVPPFTNANNSTTSLASSPPLAPPPHARSSSTAESGAANATVVGRFVGGGGSPAHPSAPLSTPQAQNVGIGLPLLSAAPPSNGPFMGGGGGTKMVSQQPVAQTHQQQQQQINGQTPGNNVMLYQNVFDGTGVSAAQNAVGLVASKNDEANDKKPVVERQWSASVSLLDVGTLPAAEDQQEQQQPEQKKQMDVTTFSSFPSNHHHNQHHNSNSQQQQQQRLSNGNDTTGNDANGRTTDFGTTDHNKVTATTTASPPAAVAASVVPPPVAPKPKTNFTSFAVTAPHHQHNHQQQEQQKSASSFDGTEKATTATRENGPSSSTDTETAIGDFSSRLRLFQQQQQQPLLNRTSSTSLSASTLASAQSVPLAPKLKRPLLSSDDLAKLAEDDQMRAKAAAAAHSHLPMENGRRVFRAGAGSSTDASSGGEQPFPSPPPSIATAGGAALLSPMSPVVDGATFEHILNDSPVPFAPPTIGSIRTKKAENRFLMQHHQPAAPSNTNANASVPMPSSSASHLPMTTGQSAAAAGAGLNQLVLEQQQRQEWRQARLASLEAESRRVNQLFTNVHGTTMGGVGCAAAEQRQSTAENFNVQ